MHRINLSREIPYSADLLVQLASDVENYPNFIPYIKAVRIWDRESDNSQFSAELMIGYKNFRVPFSTRVKIDKENRKITTKSIENQKTGFLKLKAPIKYLTCEWRFEPLNNKSIANINIDLEFSDLILGALVGANLDKATTYLINAFEKEAIRRFETI